MQTIEFPGASITVIDDDILLFEAKANTVVDKVAARHFYAEIEKHVDGDYSLIINRRHRYQLLRFEVFSVINSQSRLKAIAIVADGHAAQKMIELEAPLCEKPFAAFSSIEDALVWLRGLDQA